MTAAAAFAIALIVAEFYSTESSKMIHVYKFIDQYRYLLHLP